ncbi:MAG: hypothetical protein WCR67_07560 [Bacilli bacterium]
MGKKSSFTSEYKTRLLSDYHVSNLSMAAFCGMNGIKLSTLEYWLRKETEYSVAVNAAPPNRHNLIDVTGQVRALDVTDEVSLTINGFSVRIGRGDLPSLVGALKDE